MIPGVVKNFSGVLPGGKDIVQVTNPRGKPTFARQLVVTNTGAQPIKVLVPNDSVGTNVAAPPETGKTVAANATETFNGTIPFFTVTGTAGQTWEASATVAG